MKRPLMTLPEVAECLDMSHSSLRRAWYMGLVPAPIRLGRRGIRWHRSEVEAFLANRPAHFVGGANPQQTTEVVQ